MFIYRQTPDDRTRAFQSNSDEACRTFGGAFYYKVIDLLGTAD